MKQRAGGEVKTAAERLKIKPQTTYIFDQTAKSFMYKTLAVFSRALLANIYINYLFYL